MPHLPQKIQLTSKGQQWPKNNHLASFDWVKSYSLLPSVGVVSLIKSDLVLYLLRLLRLDFKTQLFFSVGKYTYLAFSHNKSILVRDFGFIGEALGKFRYPPYNPSSMATAGHLLKRRNFPKLPKSLPYLACVGLGVILVIAIKAFAQSIGKDLPDWV